MATILVVDDEPDIRLFVQINLELDGHQVIPAGNGADALEAVRSRPPDLMILDVLMPEVDGWGVLEQIKASAAREVKEIPILMLSALGSDEDQVRGGIEGAVRYLTKPVGAQELRDAVSSALAGDPEPVQRRRAQHGALERLARLEKGAPRPDVASTGEEPRPRLGRLEHAREGPAHAVRAPIDPGLVSGLTDRQVELLQAVRQAPSVTAAADALGMSRSNVYASLRRIGRRLGVTSVPELLDRARAGELTPGDT
jgi:CheY-like chemotaxis protein